MASARVILNGSVAIMPIGINLVCFRPLFRAPGALPLVSCLRVLVIAFGVERVASTHLTSKYSTSAIGYATQAKRPGGGDSREDARFDSARRRVAFGDSGSGAAQGPIWPGRNLTLT